MRDSDEERRARDGVSATRGGRGVGWGGVGGRGAGQWKRKLRLHFADSAL